MSLAHLGMHALIGALLPDLISLIVAQMLVAARVFARQGER
jgi:hypothetical protein